MAICPECLESKSFFARRCHNCNEEIGFIRQTYAMYVYYGTIILGLWFVVALFSGGGALYVLWIWFLTIAAPIAVIFVILFIWFSIFG